MQKCRLFYQYSWSLGARCCSTHLIDYQLTRAALDQIKSFSIRYQELNSSDAHLILSRSQKLFQNEKTIFSFDNPRDFSDDEYRLLTSLSRDDFNDLADIMLSSTIRNSSNRSIRTTMGTL